MSSTSIVKINRTIMGGTCMNFSVSSNDTLASMGASMGGYIDISLKIVEIHNSSFFIKFHYIHIPPHSWPNIGYIPNKILPRYFKGHKVEYGESIVTTVGITCNKFVNVE